MTDNLLDTNTEDLTRIDPDKDYFEELVGEKKKFKTPQDLARSKFQSDTYVKILEQRLDQMREDALKWREDALNGAKLQDLIDKFSQQQNTSSEQPLANGSLDTPAFDPTKFEETVTRLMSKRELETKQQQNYNIVKAKLEEHYGVNYQQALKQHINELGISSEELTETAKNRPQFLLKALGLDAPARSESFQAPPRSSMNTDRFSPDGGKKRTWAFYEDMRKKDPTRYSDPKTATQMHKDAIELGEAFQDGSWHAMR